MAAAYDALDEAMKERIEGLIGVHNFFWSRRGLDEDQIAFTEAEMAAIPPARHPVARVHPETGRKAIYVGSHTETIEGMAFDAARDLIEALLAHATQPEFVYEHQWRVGDLILWDNRAALHRGTEFDMRQHKRRLHRTTIAGTGPTIREDVRAL
jgi:alpha-ketoglutarate-dependent 2,4-dichlorophenoxyacetate dioxygenase